MHGEVGPEDHTGDEKTEIPQHRGHALNRAVERCWAGISLFT
jgi:hypothetical protein